MPLTKAQRRKQNQLNAQHSTGPKTDQGKSISRSNSLIHGMTASVLALPTENPEELATQAEAWSEACQPEGLDEQTLVDQLALSSIRLGRIARAEAEIVAEQVRHATDEWDRNQEVRLLEAVRMLKVDPMMAVIELKSFRTGLEWLLERWQGLQDAFQKQGFWNTPELMKESFRLDGIDPDHLVDASVMDYETVLLAVSCYAEYKNVPALMALLSKKPPEWTGRFLGLECPPEKARHLVGERIEHRIAAYAALVEELRVADEASRAGAPRRAEVLADTGQNRLILRYMKAAESTFDRTLKTLQKIQADRAKAIAEAEKAKAPNEAKLASRPPAKGETAGSCVKPRNAEPTVPEVQAEVKRVSEGAVVVETRVKVQETPRKKAG